VSEGNLEERSDSRMMKLGYILEFKDKFSKGLDSFLTKTGQALRFLLSSVGVFREAGDSAGNFSNFVAKASREISSYIKTVDQASASWKHLVDNANLLASSTVGIRELDKIIGSMSFPSGLIREAENWSKLVDGVLKRFKVSISDLGECSSREASKAFSEIMKLASKQFGGFALSKLFWKRLTDRNVINKEFFNALSKHFQSGSPEMNKASKSFWSGFSKWGKDFWRYTFGQVLSLRGIERTMERLFTPLIDTLWFLMESALFPVISEINAFLVQLIPLIQRTIRPLIDIFSTLINGLSEGGREGAGAMSVLTASFTLLGTAINAVAKVVVPIINFLMRFKIVSYTVGVILSAILVPAFAMWTYGMISNLFVQSKFILSCKRVVVALWTQSVSLRTLSKDIWMHLISMGKWLIVQTKLFLSKVLMIKAIIAEKLALSGATVAQNTYTAAVTASAFASVMLTKAMTGFKFACVGLFGGLAFLAKLLWVVTTAVWGFTASLLANPVTWIILGIVAAVGLLVFAVWKFWKPIKAFFGWLWSSVKWLWSIFTSFLSSVWEFAKGCVSVVVSVVKGVVNFIVDVANWFVGLWDKIKSVVSAVFNWFKGVLSSVWTFVKKWASAIALLVLGPFGVVVSGVMLVIRNWDKIKRAAVAVVSGVSKVLSSLSGSLKYVFSKVWGFLKWVISGVWSGIKSFASSVYNFSSGVVSGVWKSVKGVASGIGGFLSKTWGLVKKGVGGVASWFSSLGGVWSSLKSKAVGALRSIGNFLGINSETLKKFGKSLLSWVVNPFGNLGKVAVDSLKKVWSSVKGLFSWITNIKLPKWVKRLLGIDAAESVKVESHKTGEAMVRGMAEGQKAAAPQVASATEEVVQKAADYLPSSDAKVGPLSKLTDMGSALVSTFSEGMKSQRMSLLRVMNFVLGGIFKGLRPPSKISALGVQNLMVREVKVSMEGLTPEKISDPIVRSLEEQMRRLMEFLEESFQLRRDLDVSDMYRISRFDVP